MILPHREWVAVDEFTPPPDIDRSQPMTFKGVTGTFAELRSGIVALDGRRVIWVGNKRAGTVQVQERRWAGLPRFTLQNYRDVLTGKAYEVVDANGVKHSRKGDDLSGAFLNTLAVTIPSVVIPVTIAAFAAYGFAWMRSAGAKSCSRWSSPFSWYRCKSRSFRC